LQQFSGPISNLARISYNEEQTFIGGLIMPTPTDTTNIIIAAFPFLALLAGQIYRTLGKRSPATTIPALKHYTTDAVQMIEQVMGDASRTQKKSEAMKMVETLFKDAHLPVPSEAMISTAVESAVWELNLSQGKVAAPTGVQPVIKLP
jgi:LL-H family phage holin